MQKIDLLIKAIEAKYPDMDIAPDSGAFNVSGSVSVSKAAADPGQVFITWWGGPDPRPNADTLIAELSDPAHPAYDAIKAAAADEVEAMIIAFRQSVVPPEKQAIYERKEWLADNWGTATTEQKLLATDEMAGYDAVMTDLGMSFVTLQIGNAQPVQVAGIDDLLNTYRANAVIFRHLEGMAEDWRNSYPMRCTLVQPTIDPATGHGFDDLTAQLDAIRAQVAAHLANDVNSKVASLIPGLLTQYGLTPAV